jgi:hypothetical protein
MAQRRVVVLAGLAVGVLVASAGIIGWRTGRKTQPSAGDAAISENIPAAVGRRVATDLQTVTTPEQLDRYLDKLKDEVRASGHVTALQVEPGLQAIARLRPQLGDEVALRKSREFSRSLVSVENPSNQNEK